MSFQIFLILSIRFSRCNPDFHPSRRFPLRSGSGNHLFSRIVSNTVPSADMVFTVVFGMGTGVTPYRIATGNIWLFGCPFVLAGNASLTPSDSLRSSLGARSRSLYQSFAFTALACKHAGLFIQKIAARTLTTGQ